MPRDALLIPVSEWEKVKDARPRCSSKQHNARSRRSAAVLMRCEGLSASVCQIIQHSISVCVCVLLCSSRRGWGHWHRQDGANLTNVPSVLCNEQQKLTLCVAERDLTSGFYWRARILMINDDLMLLSSQCLLETLLPRYFLTNVSHVFIFYRQ